jgi:type VI secretion system secreted protein VgrG
MRFDDIHVRLASEAFDCSRLRVQSLHGKETLHRLFDFEVGLVHFKDDAPSPDEMAGARVTLILERAGVERHLHGLIAEVHDHLAPDAFTRTDLRFYRVRIVPRAFLLSLVETQDIFLGLTVPQIIQKKLATVSLDGATDLRLTGTYPEREFVVEYQESDLAFVSRLAEHLGVSFHFEHDERGDRIVFSDDNTGFLRLARPARYDLGGAAHIGVSKLTAERRIIPAYYACRDYNYRHPQVDLTAERSIDVGFAGGVIDHGSHYKTPAEGAALVKVRAEERAATQLVYAGEGNRFDFTAGGCFCVEGHADLAHDTELLITEVEHHGAQTTLGLEASVGELEYRNTFRAIPASRAYRPPRTTPCPRIYGLVTGIIDAGPGGSHRRAQIDDHGRYWVRFLFDTSPPGDAPPSRRIRMVQNHVGENYGTHLPLKAGTEVVISFIDGDPDRPLIVGAVYNPLKPSPVIDESAIVHRVKTQTGITIDMVELT